MMRIIIIWMGDTGWVFGLVRFISVWCVPYEPDASFINTFTTCFNPIGPPCIYIILCCIHKKWERDRESGPCQSGHLFTDVLSLYIHKTYAPLITHEFIWLARIISNWFYVRIEWNHDKMCMSIFFLATQQMRCRIH